MVSEVVNLGYIYRCNNNNIYINQLLKESKPAFPSSLDLVNFSELCESVQIAGKRYRHKLN